MSSVRLCQHSKRCFSSIHPSRSTFYSLATISNVNAILSQCYDMKASLPEWIHSDPSFQDRLRQRLRFFWTYHSNAIEGNTLTDSENLFFLREGITVGGKPFKDLLESRNHYFAVEILLNDIDANSELSEHTTKLINGVLLDGIASTPAVDAFGRLGRKNLTAGAYKLFPNSVIKRDGTVHEYVDPIQVEPQMEELFAWINYNLDQEQDPIIISSVAHYNMTRIHPFDDGNGRGARILMNMILLKAGYPCSIIRVEQKFKYLDALESADQGNLEPFVSFIANSVKDELDFISNEVDNFKNAFPDYCKSKNYL